MITTAWKDKIAELELVAKANAGEKTAIPVEKLDVVIRRRVARKRKGSWWLVREEVRTLPHAEDDQIFEFRNGATPSNIIGQKISVVLCHDPPELAVLSDCEVFVQQGKLHVDCAPLLKRRYTAPVPKGARFAGATSGDQSAVFIQPSSELARLIQKLW